MTSHANSSTEQTQDLTTASTELMKRTLQDLLDDVTEHKTDTAHALDLLAKKVADDLSVVDDVKENVERIKSEIKKLTIMSKLTSKVPRTCQDYQEPMP